VIERLLVLGASGDLTGRLLLPAVAQLAEADLLPPGFMIMGAADTEWSDEEFRDHVAGELGRHSSAGAEAQDTVVRSLSYQSLDLTEPADVRRLLGEPHPPTLVYLALPPPLFEPVITALSTASLGAQDAVAIEKPFGVDLDSARHLNELIRVRMAAPTIFRVDHFLSHELVLRVLVLRFLNRVFEPVWNAVHVDRVDISYLESLTLEGRARYYDRAGALKDMVQNHLMEVMTLVLMDQPARVDERSLRNARVEALRTVVTPRPEDVGARTVRARYTAGEIGTRQVPSYVHEPGVDPGRGTETYAAVTLEVESGRWAGVPFTLRSGKALPTDSAEIAIHFRGMPRYMQERWPTVEPNVLRVSLREPTVRLSATLNGETAVENHQLEARPGTSGRHPYSNLFLQMLRRDPTLFVRGDEAEEAWRIVDPVLAAWVADEVPMREYRAGGLPPH
jgi:glucose-6-phosphate 1-dehydrogenase